MTAYRSLTSTIRDVLYRAPRIPADLPQPTIDRIAALQPRPFSPATDAQRDFGEGIANQGGGFEAIQDFERDREAARNIAYGMAAPALRGIDTVNKIAAQRPLLSKGGNPIYSGGREVMVEDDGRTPLDAFRALNRVSPDIPYSREIANVAGEIGARTGRGYVKALTGPAGIAERLVPEQVRPSEIGAKAGELAAESLVPTEAWHAALEFVPGVGTVPDLIRLAKKGAPDALAALARATDNETVQRFVRAAQSEAGSHAPLDPLGKADPDALPAASVEAAEPSRLAPLQPTDQGVTVSRGLPQIAKDFREMIVRARKLGPEQARMISEQKAARVTGAAARLEQGGGMPAFHESKSLLAGEYGKPTFEPLNVPAEDVNAMVDFIGTQALPLADEHPEMFYFRKLGALQAIEKATMGVKPAENELAKLETFFPGNDLRAAFDEQVLTGEARGLSDVPQEFPSDAGGMQTRLADAINESYVGAVTAGKGTPEEISRWVKGLRLATSPLALVKTIVTSFDVGWAGRQGFRLLARNPAEWWRMYGKQFKALASEANLAEIDAATRGLTEADAAIFARSQDPRFEHHKLAYLERGTGDPERSGEEFLSVAGENKAIDIARAALSPFERAFVGPGNLMRQEVLRKLVRRLVRVNKVPVNDTDFQLMMDTINNATLRGNTKWLGNPTASTLGSLLFSLKGVVSGPQFILDGVRVMFDTRYSLEARKIVAEQVGAYIAMGMTLMGAAAATGFGLNKAGAPAWVGVDLNHNSKTFGDMHVGKVRWNFWGADAPMVRFLLGVSDGMQQPAAGLPATGASRERLTKNFIANKIAPGLPRALLVEAFYGGNDPITGQDINTPGGMAKFLLNQIKPIGAGSTYESYGQAGPIAAPFVAAAEVSGLSTSTYSNAPDEDQLAEAKRNEAIKKIAVPDNLKTAYANAVNYAVVTTLPGQYKTYDEFVAAEQKIADASRTRLEDGDRYKQVQAAIEQRRIQLREQNPRLDAYIVVTEGAKPRTDRAATLVELYTGQDVPVAER